MIIAHDIREPLGKRFDDLQETELIFDIGAIAHELPISKDIRENLELLSKTTRHHVYNILINSDEKKGPTPTMYQGRGHNEAPPNLYKINQNSIYTKGSGAYQYLQHQQPIDIKGNLIHQLFADGPFYDNRLSRAGFPRLTGRCYGDEALLEAVNATRIFVDIVLSNDYRTFKEVLSNGVCIPIAAATFPGLTNYVKPHVEEYLDPKFTWGNRKLANVSILAPSKFRITDKQKDDPTGSRSKYIARTFREMWKASSASYSAQSFHLQNIYFANGICGQADNDDLVFTTNMEVPEKEIIRQFASLIWCAISIHVQSSQWRRISPFSFSDFIAELSDYRVYAKDDEFDNPSIYEDAISGLRRPNQVYIPPTKLTKQFRNLNYEEHVNSYPRFRY